MTFVNKTIKSKYLEEEFEVSCWEMQQDGRTVTIIEHAAFEDIIFNKLSQAKTNSVEGFNYELEPIIGIANHPVFKCTMTDSSSLRKVIAIGESDPSTLVNKISKQNPVIMAGNRAFDRAAIRYLDLEGKVYSSEEIPEEYANSSSSVSNESPANMDEHPLFAEDSFSPDKQDEYNAPVQVESEPEDPGAVVINFGKYRGKNMTVSAICQEDANWAEFTATMNVDKAGETTKKQVQALKTYLETKQKK